MASDQELRTHGQGSFRMKVLEKVLSLAEMGGKAGHGRPLHGRGDVGVDVHSEEQVYVSRKWTLASGANMGRRSRSDILMVIGGEDCGEALGVDQAHSGVAISGRAAADS
jgi:hypothetical protein